MCHFLVSGPQVEPVSLTEAADAVGGVEGDEEFLLSCLVVAARAFLEAEVGRAFISQRWLVELEHWPASGFFPPPRPLAPFLLLNSVKVYREGGEVQLRRGGISIDDTGEWPMLAVSSEETWGELDTATGGITLEVTVGYGDAPEDVPINLRRAIIELATHWHCHREPISFGSGKLALPRIVLELIGPYRAPAIRRVKKDGKS